MRWKLKAAYVDRPGPIEAIRYGDLPLPVLQAQDVLVRVSAVTVNHVDTFIRSGAFETGIPLPFIIGRDMVGIVESVGPQVTQFKVGDSVWSNCLGIEGYQGTFAEYVAAPADRLFSLPPNVNPQEAVAVLHSALTAATGLFTKAQLAAGDNLFIHGGSGSIGLAVLQIAKAHGARVGVTAGDEEKAQRCRDFGADLVVNYHREDLGQALQLWAPQGIDIFWEATSALDLEQILPNMAQNGRLVVIAGKDRQCKFPLWPFYTRNCSIHGFTVTGTGVSDYARYARQINAWLANHTLKAKIQTVMPLSEAARAHEMQEQGGLSGKIVLVPSS